MFTYYLVAPFLYFFAYLPTNSLYRIADVIAFVLRNIIGYRKEVVYKNLRNSFPHKNEAEIQQLAKESYTHLADKIVENVRCIVISKEEVAKRMRVSNPEMLDELYKQGKSVVMMIGHVGAWEYAVYELSHVCPHKLYAIVSKVKNPYFNRMIQRTRGRMGMHLIMMQESKEFFKETPKEPSALALISDQSPSNIQRAYWTTFMNQDTAFFTGGEGYAKMHNCAVVYAKIVQVSRGIYDGEFIKITDSAIDEKPNAITEKYVRILEQHILQNPSDWLWSHKRWKHKRNVEAKG